MALLRKLIYRKLPDGLLYLSDRIYVFDCCFRAQDLGQHDYKAYFSNIISQYMDNEPQSSIMILNFRGEKESRITSALLGHNVTIMDYPRDYEGFPLLSIEVIHHFLKSSASWLSVSVTNTLLMHFEYGGWPVLAFMVAALLLYRKSFTVESKALDMVHKQVPSNLLPVMSPMNHVPSQLRYLKFVSRRNTDSQWPPENKILTLDCVIMRMIPDFDGKGGCCPIFRIYGRDPLLHVDKTPKLLFSTPRRPKYVRYYNRAEHNNVAKCDINCHIQGDVVLECISLHDDLVKEKIMYRAMFNTAFIQSNMLILNRDEIDVYRDAKGQFHKDFKAELILSELDVTASMIPEDLSGFEQEGLPMEAFDEVNEIFSGVDWLESHLRETATSSYAVTSPAPTAVKIQPREALQLSKFNLLSQQSLRVERHKPGKTSRVKFNVGGRVFETTSTTLAMAGRKSYFGSMFDENWDLQLNSSNEHFIDRNSDCFSILLDLLRTGELHIPPNIPEKLFYREALFYGVMDHVRSAKWGQFNGNHLYPSKSITGHATDDGTLIRASSNGGCCVAYGNMVHIYDWMLEEHPPINLDYQSVNDAGWVGPADPTGLVISTCERLGCGQGGMGLFNSITGELKYRYNMTHESVAKSYTAGALSFNENGSKLLSSCKGRSTEYGIGVWDQNTGHQVDFFYEPPKWSLGDANKLQWLNSSNCLFVATLFPKKDSCYLSLIDFRSKSMVWSFRSNECVRDAIPIEENNSICVINEFEDLGFIDTRSNSGPVRWNSRSSLVKGEVTNEKCYPKLALHKEQLFSSMNDCISVFSGSDWVRTSRLRRGFGGPLCDFSIGGDRLFALHSEENVFDIWETPPPPPPIL